MISELTGITIGVFNPMRGGAKEFIRTIYNYDSYSHKSDAFGGYIEASFSIMAQFSELSEWFSDGIGRHIEVYDNSGLIIWAGFINELTINYSARKITIGPLTALANKVRVLYTTLIVSAIVPPPRGTQTFTGYYSNADSIARYGTFEKTVNAGECTDASAVEIAQGWLRENAFPVKNETLSIGEGGPAVIEIKCAGYYNFLNNYNYSLVSKTTTIASAKIQSILSADPNLVFNTDYSGIVLNSTSIEANTQGASSNIETIKSIVSKGDSAYNRWIFGIYADQKVRYEPITATEAYYVYSLSDGVNSLGINYGAKVKPWQIVPGKFLLYTDFPLGKITGDIRSDPNTVFIESVSYNAPYGLTINGGRISTVEQRLARLGLGGA